MKTTSISRTLFACISVTVALGAGCASVAVSNDAIETNTAFALGLPKGAFSIADRRDEGVKSSYGVKTKSGKQYSCYVTGTVSIVGRVVSDAVCTEVGKSSKQSTGGGNGSCNALLKAAGRCQ